MPGWSVSGIQSPADLSGKKFGAPVVGAMAMAMYELFSFIEKHTTG